MEIYHNKLLRIHYDSIEFSEESVLIRTIDRYSTLSKAMIFASTTDSARTAQAGMGRQPKKKIDINDICTHYSH